MHFIHLVIMHLCSYQLWVQAVDHLKVVYGQHHTYTYEALELLQDSHRELERRDTSLLSDIHQ